MKTTGVFLRAFEISDAKVYLKYYLQISFIEIRVEGAKNVSDLTWNKYFFIFNFYLFFTYIPLFSIQRK